MRELKTVIERLVLSAGQPGIDAARVEAVLQDGPPVDPPPGEGLRELRERIERAYILQTLAAHQWRIQETAVALGIDRTYLWKLMRRLGIQAPAEALRESGRG